MLVCYLTGCIIMVLPYLQSGESLSLTSLLHGVSHDLSKGHPIRSKSLRWNFSFSPKLTIGILESLDPVPGLSDLFNSLLNFGQKEKFHLGDFGLIRV